MQNRYPKFTSQNQIGLLLRKYFVIYSKFKEGIWCGIMCFDVKLTQKQELNVLIIKYDNR